MMLLEVKLNLTKEELNEIKNDFNNGGEINGDSNTD